MLAAAHRVTDAATFREVVRRGSRASTRRVVVHVRVTGGPVRAGFVVSKAVGGAVQRNRVKRRLRHLVSERIAHGRLAGCDVVVRALPAAAGATSAQLGSELDDALTRTGVLAPPAGVPG